MRRSCHTVTSHRDLEAWPGAGWGGAVPHTLPFIPFIQFVKRIIKMLGNNIRYFRVDVESLWVARGHEGNLGGIGEGGLRLQPGHLWE